MNLIGAAILTVIGAQQLEQLGYKMVVFPLSALFSAARAVLETLRSLREHGTTLDGPDLVSFHEFEKMIGLQRFRELERRFVS